MIPLSTEESPVSLESFRRCAAPIQNEQEYKFVSGQKSTSIVMMIDISEVQVKLWDQYDAKGNAVITQIQGIKFNHEVRLLCHRIQKANSTIVFEKIHAWLGMSNDEKRSSCTQQTLLHSDAILCSHVVEYENAGTPSDPIPQVLNIQLSGLLQGNLHVPTLSSLLLKIWHQWSITVEKCQKEHNAYQNMPVNPTLIHSRILVAPPLQISLSIDDIRISYTVDCDQHVQDIKSIPVISDKLVVDIKDFCVILQKKSLLNLKFKRIALSLLCNSNVGHEEPHIIGSIVDFTSYTSLLNVPRFDSSADINILPSNPYQDRHVQYYVEVGIVCFYYKTTLFQTIIHIVQSSNAIFDHLLVQRNKDEIKTGTETGSEIDERRMLNWRPNSVKLDISTVLLSISSDASSVQSTPYSLDVICRAFECNFVENKSKMTPLPFRLESFDLKEVSFDFFSISWVKKFCDKLTNNSESQSVGSLNKENDAVLLVEVSSSGAIATNFDDISFTSDIDSSVNEDIPRCNSVQFSTIHSIHLGYIICNPMCLLIDDVVIIVSALVKDAMMVRHELGCKIDEVDIGSATQGLFQFSSSSFGQDFPFKVKIHQFDFQIPHWSPALQIQNDDHYKKFENTRDYNINSTQILINFNIKENDNNIIVATFNNIKIFQDGTHYRIPIPSTSSNIDKKCILKGEMCRASLCKNEIDNTWSVDLTCPAMTCKSLPLTLSFCQKCQRNWNFFIQIIYRALSTTIATLDWQVPPSQPITKYCRENNQNTGGHFESHTNMIDVVCHISKFTFENPLELKCHLTLEGVIFKYSFFDVKNDRNTFNIGSVIYKGINNEKPSECLLKIDPTTSSHYAVAVSLVNWNVETVKIGSLNCAMTALLARICNNGAQEASFATSFLLLLAKADIIAAMTLQKQIVDSEGFVLIDISKVRQIADQLGECTITGVRLKYKRNLSDKHHVLKGEELCVQHFARNDVKTMITAQDFRATLSSRDFPLQNVLFWNMRNLEFEITLNPSLTLLNSFLQLNRIYSYLQQWSMRNKILFSDNPDGQDREWMIEAQCTEQILITCDKNRFVKLHHGCHDKHQCMIDMQKCTLSFNGFLNLSDYYCIIQCQSIEISSEDYCNTSITTRGVTILQSAPIDAVSGTASSNTGVHFSFVDLKVSDLDFEKLSEDINNFMVSYNNVTVHEVSDIDLASSSEGTYVVELSRLRVTFCTECHDENPLRHMVELHNLHALWIGQRLNNEWSTDISANLGCANIFVTSSINNQEDNQAQLAIIIPSAGCETEIFSCLFMSNGEIRVDIRDCVEIKLCSLATGETLIDIFTYFYTKSRDCFGSMHSIAQPEALVEKRNHNITFDICSGKVGLVVEKELIGIRIVSSSFRAKRISATQISKKIGNPSEKQTAHKRHAVHIRYLGKLCNISIFHSNFMIGHVKKAKISSQTAAIFNTTSRFQVSITSMYWVFDQATLENLVKIFNLLNVKRERSSHCTKNDSSKKNYTRSLLKPKECTSPSMFLLNVTITLHVTDVVFAINNRDEESTLMLLMNSMQGSVASKIKSAQLRVQGIAIQRISAKGSPITSSDTFKHLLSRTTPEMCPLLMHVSPACKLHSHWYAAWSRWESTKIFSQILDFLHPSEAAVLSLCCRAFFSRFIRNYDIKHTLLMIPKTISLDVDLSTSSEKIITTKLRVWVSKFQSWICPADIACGQSIVPSLLKVGAHSVDRESRLSNFRFSLQLELAGAKMIFHHENNTNMLQVTSTSTNIVKLGPLRIRWTGESDHKTVFRLVSNNDVESLSVWKHNFRCLSLKSFTCHCSVSPPNVSNFLPEIKSTTLPISKFSTTNTIQNASLENVSETASIFKWSIALGMLTASIPLLSESIHDLNWIWTLCLSKHNEIKHTSGKVTDISSAGFGRHCVDMSLAEVNIEIPSAVIIPEAPQQTKIDIDKIVLSFKKIESAFDFPSQKQPWQRMTQDKVFLTDDGTDLTLYSSFSIIVDHAFIRQDFIRRDSLHVLEIWDFVLTPKRIKSCATHVMIKTRMCNVRLAGMADISLLKYYVKYLKKTLQPFVGVTNTSSSDEKTLSKKKKLPLGVYEIIHNGTNSLGIRLAKVSQKEKLLTARVIMITRPNVQCSTQHTICQGDELTHIQGKSLVGGNFNQILDRIRQARPEKPITLRFQSGKIKVDENQTHVSLSCSSLEILFLVEKLGRNIASTVNERFIYLTPFIKLEATDTQLNTKFNPCTSYEGDLSTNFASYSWIDGQDWFMLMEPVSIDLKFFLRLSNAIFDDILFQVRALTTINLNITPRTMILLEEGIKAFSNHCHQNHLKRQISRKNQIEIVNQLGRDIIISTRHWQQYLKNSTTYSNICQLSYKNWTSTILKVIVQSKNENGITKSNAEATKYEVLHIFLTSACGTFFKILTESGTTNKASNLQGFIDISEGIGVMWTKEITPSGIRIIIQSPLFIENKLETPVDIYFPPHQGQSNNESSCSVQQYKNFTLKAGERLHIKSPDFLRQNFYIRPHCCADNYFTVTDTYHIIRSWLQFSLKGGCNSQHIVEQDSANKRQNFILALYLQHGGNRQDIKNWCEIYKMALRQCASPSLRLKKQQELENDVMTKVGYQFNDVSIKFPHPKTEDNKGQITPITIRNNSMNRLLNNHYCHLAVQNMQPVKGTSHRLSIKYISLHAPIVVVNHLPYHLEFMIRGNGDSNPSKYAWRVIAPQQRYTVTSFQLRSRPQIRVRLLWYMWSEWEDILLIARPTMKASCNILPQFMEIRDQHSTVSISMLNLPGSVGVANRIVHLFSRYVIQICTLSCSKLSIGFGQRVIKNSADSNRTAKLSHSSGRQALETQSSSSSWSSSRTALSSIIVCKPGMAMGNRGFVTSIECQQFNSTTKTWTKVAAHDQNIPKTLREVILQNITSTPDNLFWKWDTEWQSQEEDDAELLGANSSIDYSNNEFRQSSTKLRNQKENDDDGGERSSTVVWWYAPKVKDMFHLKRSMHSGYIMRNVFKDGDSCRVSFTKRRFSRRSTWDNNTPQIPSWLKFHQVKTMFNFHHIFHKSIDSDTNPRRKSLGATNKSRIPSDVYHDNNDDENNWSAIECSSVNDHGHLKAACTKSEHNIQFHYGLFHHQFLHLRIAGSLWSEAIDLSHLVVGRPIQIELYSGFRCPTKEVRVYILEVRKMPLSMTNGQLAQSQFSLYHDKKLLRQLNPDCLCTGISVQSQLYFHNATDFQIQFRQQGLLRTIFSVGPGCACDYYFVNHMALRGLQIRCLEKNELAISNESHWSKCILVNRKDEFALSVMIFDGTLTVLRVIVDNGNVKVQSETCSNALCTINNFSSHHVEFIESGSNTISSNKSKKPPQWCCCASNKNEVFGWKDVHNPGFLLVRVAKSSNTEASHDTKEWIICSPNAQVGADKQSHTYTFCSKLLFISMIKVGSKFVATIQDSELNDDFDKCLNTPEKHDDPIESRFVNILRSPEVNFQAANRHGIQVKVKVKSKLSIGLSVMSNSLVELLYLSVIGPASILSYNSVNGMFTFQGTCKHAQADCHLSLSHFPVIICQQQQNVNQNDEPVFLSNTEAADAVKSNVSQKEIAFQLVLDGCYKQGRILFIKHAFLNVQPLCANIDSRVVHVLEGMYRSCFDSSFSTGLDSSWFLYSQHFAGSYSDRLQTPAPILWQNVFVKEVPMLLNFAVSIGEGERHRSFSSLKKSLSRIDRAHLQFERFARRKIHATLHGLLQSIYTHATALFWNKVVMLAGSMNAIGNPMGLLGKVGTGTIDLVAKPLDGARDGGLDGALGGSAAGGISLVKNTVNGVVQSAGGLTNTLATAAAHVSLDEEYLANRQVHSASQMAHNTSNSVDLKSEPRDVFDGVALGTIAIARGIWDGVTDIYTQVKRSADYRDENGQRDKNAGRVAGRLMKGVGRGLLGTVVKPAVGAIDAATSILDGMKNSTSGSIRNINSRGQKQVRQQRAIYHWGGSAPCLRQYDPEAASIYAFLESFRLAGATLSKHERLSRFKWKGVTAATSPYSWHLLNDRDVYVRHFEMLDGILVVTTAALLDVTRGLHLRCRIPWETVHSFRAATVKVHNFTKASEQGYTETSTGAFVACLLVRFTGFTETHPASSSSIRKHGINVCTLEPDDIPRIIKRTTGSSVEAAAAAQKLHSLIKILKECQLVSRSSSRICELNVTL